VLLSSATVTPDQGEVNSPPRFVILKVSKLANGRIRLLLEASTPSTFHASARTTAAFRRRHASLRAPRAYGEASAPGPAEAAVLTIVPTRAAARLLGRARNLALTVAVTLIDPSGVARSTRTVDLSVRSSAKRTTGTASRWHTL
jgi:hypothetical protein